MNKASEIITAIQTHYDISLARLKSKSRVRNDSTVEARQMLSYLLYCNTEATLVTIGKFLNRDHSTIVHSVQTIEYYTAATYSTPEKQSYETIKRLLPFEARTYKQPVKSCQLLLEEF